METKSKSLLLVAGIAALSLSAVTFAAGAFSNNNLGNISKVSGTGSKSVTLTSTHFNNTVLENFAVPDNRSASPVNRPDKKFKIELEGGNYILGAIIYHDCGYQYIGTSTETNATLGDAFTLDNTDTKSNAFNFHIAFALDNIESISYNYTVTLTAPGEVSANNEYCSAVRTRQYSNDGTDESFYNELTTRGYLGVVDNKVPTEIEGKYVDYYSHTEGSFGDDVFVGIPDEKQYGYNSVNTNMVFIQFHDTGKLVQAGRKIAFTLDSITFNYHCNED